MHPPLNKVKFITLFYCKDAFTGAITRPNFYMKLNLKTALPTNFLLKYLAGFIELILKISKCFTFRLQVYETWFDRDSNTGFFAEIVIQ